MRVKAEELLIAVFFMLVCERLGANKLQQHYPSEGWNVFENCGLNEEFGLILGE